MPHTIQASSEEFVRVPVTATVDGAAVNPTTDLVEVALVPAGTALAEEHYAVGTWQTDTVDGVVTYYACRLVETGELAPGTYRCYVRITDDPETPVLEATDIITVS